MSDGGPVDLRGTGTIVATFGTKIRVFIFSGSNESRSWIDPQRMASLRLVRSERRPFVSRRDSVGIHPLQRFWSARDGDSGTSATDAPLDELSFIYFLRTQPLADDTVYTFNRFYEVRRTPTTVRVIGRETVTTPAGVFPATEIEMRVKDRRDLKDEGVLRIWLSDDACRLPVRIETAMPLLGTGILELESAETPHCRSANVSAVTPPSEND